MNPKYNKLAQLLMSEWWYFKTILTRMLRVTVQRTTVLRPSDLSSGSEIREQVVSPPPFIVERFLAVTQPPAVPWWARAIHAHSLHMNATPFWNDHLIPKCHWKIKWASKILKNNIFVCQIITCMKQNIRKWNHFIRNFSWNRRTQIYLQHIFLKFLFL